jgi:hypothetical protein
LGGGSFILKVDYDFYETNSTSSHIDQLLLASPSETKQGSGKKLEPSKMYILVVHGLVIKRSLWEDFSNYSTLYRAE